MRWPSGMLHGTPGTSRGNVTFFPEIIPDKFPGKIVFPNKIFFISHVDPGDKKYRYPGIVKTYINNNKF